MPRLHEDNLRVHGLGSGPLLGHAASIPTSSAQPPPPYLSGSGSAVEEVEDTALLGQQRALAQSRGRRQRTRGVGGAGASGAGGPRARGSSLAGRGVGGRRRAA